MSLSEAAPAFANYHLHTEYSYCCEDISTGRLAEFLPQWPHVVAITDHSMHLVFDRELGWCLSREDAPALLEDCRERGRERMLRYLEHVRTLAQDGVLIGTELDILPDGRPVFPEDLLGEIDIRVGAVHAMATVRMRRPADEVMDEWRSQNRALFGLGVEILAHPFRYLMSNKIAVADEDVYWVVEEAAAHGVALEVNSHYVFPELDRLMVRECLAKGVRIAIGTDAHRWNEVTDFSYHDRILSECGVVTEEQRSAVLYRHDT